MGLIKIKNIIAGAAAALASSVGIMDCYPLVPAIFAVYLLWNNKTILFYIGLFTGMGYFMSFQTMTKYLFIIVVSFIGIRFYSWINKRCSGPAAAVITALTTCAMGISAEMTGSVDKIQIILSIAESAVIFGAVVITDRGLKYIEFMGKSEKSTSKSLLPDKEEAFAASVGGLAKMIAKAGCEVEQGKSDHTAKLESEITGRMCACCEGCVICWNDNRQSMSQKIVDLINAVKERMDKKEIIEKVYVDNCPYYEKMVDAATDAFLRLELNEAWYRRLKENRQVIAKQLDAMAVLMEDWVNNEKCVDGHRKMKITKIYVEAKETGFTVEEVHIYENADGYAIIKADIYTKWDGGLPVGAFIKAVSSATGMAWRAAKDTKALITSICTPVTLYEDTTYYALSGIATKKKTGSSVSGDSFGMFELDSGIYNVCLSDGMGSGKRANDESNLVVDLLEKFLEAGFKKSEAIDMMNSAMVLSGEGDSFSTVDFAAIDLYSGVAEIIKIGAAVSFVKRNRKVEVIQCDSLPVGYDAEQKINPVKTKLENGEFLVMVTDGVLEYLHVKNPVEKLCEIVADAGSDNAGVISQDILDRVLLMTGGYAMDDMTVITIGVWEK